MINDLLKNTCLIVFALIGPITLPAGEFKGLSQYKFPSNTKEIILSSNTFFILFPKLMPQNY